MEPGYMYCTKKVYSSCKEISLRYACETHAKYAPNKGIRNVDYTMLLKT